MGISENVAIFEDTQKRYMTIPELSNAIWKSNNAQEVILETTRISVPIPRFSKSARVVVSPKRSFEAANNYLPNTTCVLNFASATNPGGGVVRGSSAQEECLCRCSTLYANLTAGKLWKQFYEPHRVQRNPLYNDDCIYTPDVIVFKSDTHESKLLPQAEWWKVNVITCAAPNLRPDRFGNVQVIISKDELFRLHVKRMRRILNIACEKGNDVVILGAYGCGAFQNPPEVVASAMKKVVEEYRYHFRVIEFAVYCSPRDDQNHRIFQRILGSCNDRSF